MTDGPALAFQSMTGGESHYIVILLLLPFAAIFLRAAWLELRRWYLFGPAGNNRARFPIDASAPGYDLPPVAVAARSE
ncbi:hypothetical protein [Chachezhania antarctica]|uniref:hypothetical protein n=1 Tax=Chachezhania antarctica TaxID=2340860 RepID=UPI000EAB83BF|nr:hypothetical protein [Chachezhania antarctica]|tara:strand:- start:1520 stop:1753 length:234 start_codon:yes stop_codon:yes gene_type:complete